MQWASPLMPGEAVTMDAKLVCEGLDAADLAVFIDGQRLRQLLMNLLANAARATSRGQIELRCAATVQPLAEGEVSASVRLKFEVTDTGQGIAPQKLAKLFDEANSLELWQDAATSRRGGLGLLICRRLARAMGGELKVRSAEGRGSAIWFEINARQAAVNQTNVPARAGH